MKATQTCPKCSSRRFIVTSEVRSPDPDNSRYSIPLPPICAQVEQHARDTRGAFESWICAQCGLTEWYATGLQSLSPKLIAALGPHVKYVDAAAPTGGGPFR